MRQHSVVQDSSKTMTEEQIKHVTQLLQKSESCLQVQEQMIHLFSRFEKDGHKTD